jgi:hypothetical protein
MQTFQAPVIPDSHVPNVTTLGHRIQGSFRTAKFGKITGVITEPDPI